MNRSAAIALGIWMLVGCSMLPTPTIPPEVQDAVARANVTLAPAPVDADPAVDQAAASVAAQAAARESGWRRPLEPPMLAGLVSLGALEGIDPADHPLVWIVLSDDGRSELLLVISGTNGEVIASQQTTIERP